MFNVHSMSIYELKALKRMSWNAETACDERGDSEEAERMAAIWLDCVLELGRRAEEAA